jgi:hypothetical protein
VKREGGKKKYVWMVHQFVSNLLKNLSTYMHPFQTQESTNAMLFLTLVVNLRLFSAFNGTFYSHPCTTIVL